MKILVDCCDQFLGDTLFLQSLAPKFKSIYQGCHITYALKLPQTKLLLERNPYIDMVSVDSVNSKDFDLIANTPRIDQSIPATLFFQIQNGIEDQSLEFDTHTIKEYDASYKGYLDELYSSRKIIAYQVDWSWRAYQSTPETLKAGEGAPHRDMDTIIQQLSEHYWMIPVGFGREYPSSNALSQDPQSYASVASVIKNCDYFIGSEGGLQNLACSVGTKCIITTDFIAQQYWTMGRVLPHLTIAMGPATYYPMAGHSHIHPCINDEAIASKIIDLIDNDKSEVFEFNESTWNSL